MRRRAFERSQSGQLPRGSITIMCRPVELSSCVTFKDYMEKVGLGCGLFGRLLVRVGIRHWPVRDRVSSLSFQSLFSAVINVRVESVWGTLIFGTQAKPRKIASCTVSESASFPLAVSVFA